MVYTCYTYTYTYTYTYIYIIYITCGCIEDLPTPNDMPIPEKKTNSIVASDGDLGHR